MKVSDHEPHTWFLLEESGRYYIDARVTRSAAEWSILVELTPQEYREYHAIGRLYLSYLAARIHNFADEYSARDLTKALGEKAMRAIQEWRTSGGGRPH
ncbi:MAG TPA: hypothetical protein VGD45_13380 [Steroidobacter sp.]|uniref:hypothetical protein n=1 Tax=Steroidobacter sp. TaxID=1978227 RepID=UPI002ED87D1A